MLRGIDLKQAYARGENISALLRAEESEGNTEAVIETAYDLQAGTYVRSQIDPERRRHKARYAAEIAKVLDGLGGARHLLEAGVGEATTLSHVIQALSEKPEDTAGVDLSWSRLRWARQWLREERCGPVDLAVATLCELPFVDNAFEIVYTSHSIEPNHGREVSILQELHRVCARYLVLLEPGYELADAGARARMEHHGYCRGLPEHARSLGMKVVMHSLFPVVARNENPTALIVIEKDTAFTCDHVRWACPGCGSLLMDVSGFWYCSVCFLAYPVLGGLPCLRREKGLIASQLLEHPTV